MWIFVLLFAALLLTALLLSPVCFSLQYATDASAQGYIRWLVIKRRFPSGEKKTENIRKRAPKKRKEPAEKKKGPAARELGELLPILIRAAVKPAKRLLRGIRITRLHLDILVATGDAAETAIAYGRINAAVCSLYALLRERLNMAEPHISIRPSYLAEESEVRLHLRARVLPATVLLAGGAFLGAFLKGLLRRKTAREAPEKQAA